ncbi:hypothetical protein H0H93_009574 [Arthromyces matolae]|nr:hypothetical protein H0H93_009574 [Arthromyces matolae]
MSPTFNRLKYFGLVSLIAAAAIHQSSLLAEAAPTPTPLPNHNELLPRDSLVPRSINSDFLGPTVPMMIPSDMTSDFDCGLDQFANDPRCVAAPTLLPRNWSQEREDAQLAEIHAQLQSFYELAEQGDVPVDRGKSIVKTEIERLEQLMNDPEASFMLKDAAVKTYIELFSSKHFQSLAHEISSDLMTSALWSLGEMDSLRDSDMQITSLVYHYLTRADITEHCLPTVQALVISKEILQLKKAKKDAEKSKKEVSQVVVEYLDKFFALLDKKTYRNNPEMYTNPTAHMISDEELRIQHATINISSRYQDIKRMSRGRIRPTQRKNLLKGLVEEYKNEGKNTPDDAVMIVLKGYIALLQSKLETLS